MSMQMSNLKGFEYFNYRPSRCVECTHSYDTAQNIMCDLYHTIDLWMGRIGYARRKDLKFQCPDFRYSLDSNPKDGTAF